MGYPELRDLNALRGVQQLLSLTPNLNPRDVLLTLKLGDASSLWEALLDLQFRLCKSAELSFLLQDDAWNRARNVLEIGYGDTGLPGELAPYFPDKEFLTCALPTSLILKKHKTSLYLDSIAKVVGTRKFDVVVLRVVVQKVSQLGHFITNILDYVSPKGHLLIVDAADDLMMWNPAIPTLDALMDSLREHQQKSGGGRTAAEKVLRRASLFGCRPVRHEKVPVMTYSESCRRDFYAFFLLLSEVMVRASGPILDQTALLKDLEHWIATPKAHAQFGLYFVELTRREK